MASPEFDVAIAGTGLVADALAIALSGAGVTVARLGWGCGRDRGPEPEIGHAGTNLPGAAGFSDRSIALSHGSRQILGALNPSGRVWEALEPSAAAIRCVHVSEQGGFGFTRFQAEDFQVPALGYVLPAHRIESVLAAQLQGWEIPFRYPDARIAELVRCPGWLEIRLVDGDGEAETVRTRLLVAADGGRFSIRQMLAMPVSERSYGQHALIATVHPARAHGGCAFERFTEHGPLAVLPLAGERCGVVWSVRDELARALLALPEPEFVEALQSAFGRRLGRLGLSGPRAAFPVRLSAVEDPVLGRTVLVGSAATQLHPVAGQGFNLGLRDVAALSDCIIDTMERGGDPGAPSSLHRYRSWRAADRRRTIRITDGLVRAFASRLPGLRALRSAGMLLADLMPATKSAFARQTMGVATPSPRMVRAVALPRLSSSC